MKVSKKNEERVKEEKRKIKSRNSQRTNKKRVKEDNVNEERVNKERVTRKTWGIVWKKKVNQFLQIQNGLFWRKLHTSNWTFLVRC